MHETESLEAYDLEHINIIKQFETISQRESFSTLKLKSIRDDLSKNLSSVAESEHFAVITTGSYGRKEASEESDMDLFVIFDDEKIKACPAEVCETIDSVLKQHNIKIQVAQLRLVLAQAKRKANC